ncbi:hypothetical protein MKZ38_007218 [Zalerion maritima]|uniref:Uncharacterized protein n=1 Tax=Zalerion maritima TaxID=339359 RepID=A0AAD5RMV2_9PEZI|nr:hypothetical protein MKZ38_007218 [Zalerion maritima]
MPRRSKGGKGQGKPPSQPQGDQKTGTGNARPPPKNTERARHPVLLVRPPQLPPPKPSALPSWHTCASNLDPPDQTIHQCRRPTWFEGDLTTMTLSHHGDLIQRSSDAKIVVETTPLVVNVAAGRGLAEDTMINQIDLHVAVVAMIEVNAVVAAMTEVNAVTDVEVIEEDEVGVKDNETTESSNYR